MDAFLASFWECFHRFRVRSNFKVPGMKLDLIRFSDSGLLDYAENEGDEVDDEV